ncbi:MAG: hypothetical protein PHU63_02445 [Candidatus ainarchaeum sp.]|nr:hypothetical protein [Candidatus ainarchaeum sp.]
MCSSKSNTFSIGFVNHIFSLASSDTPDSTAALLEIAARGPNEFNFVTNAVLHWENFLPERDHEMILNTLEKLNDHFLSLPRSGNGSSISYANILAHAVYRMHLSAKFDGDHFSKAKETRAMYMRSFLLELCKNGHLVPVLTICFEDLNRLGIGSEKSSRIEHLVYTLYQRTPKVVLQNLLDFVSRGEQRLDSFLPIFETLISLSLNEFIFNLCNACSSSRTPAETTDTAVEILKKIAKRGQFSHQKIMEAMYRTGFRGEHPQRIFSELLDSSSGFSFSSNLFRRRKPKSISLKKPNRSTPYKREHASRVRALY